jgi:hypothetical protein
MSVSDGWIDNDGYNELWIAGKRFFENDSEEFPKICPLCGHRHLHLYVHRWKNNDATMWVWCGQCKRTTHGLIRDCPRWYRNYSVVEEGDLSSHPDRLAEKSIGIDVFMNTFIEKFPLPPFMT